MTRKNNFRILVQDLSGKPLRVLLLLLTDLLWSSAVLSAILLGYRHWSTTAANYRTAEYLWIIPVLIVCFNSVSRLYHGSIINPGSAIHRVEEIRRLFLATLGSYILGILALLAAGRLEHYPAFIFFFCFAVTILGFPVIRFLIRLVMKKLRIGQIRVLISGAGKSAVSVGKELESSCYYGYRVLGYLDDDPAKRNARINGKPCLGRVCDAERLAKKYNTSYVICCLPPHVLPKVVKSYTRIFEHVLVIPTSGVLPITAVYPVLIGFISGLELQNRIHFLVPRLLKTGLEIVLAALALAVLLPLFVVLALLVKCSSPGPVFYVADRLGRGGRKIKVLKFRSMYQDASSRLEAMLEENPALKAEWQKQFKLRNDPRITRIGRFLRWTSLDELPQFFNVLKGDMAIIGPRPIVEEEVKYYGKNYDYFLRVKPGITGLWQVSGRSDVNYDQRVAMDMFYVMNWSIWLDWFILFKTIYVMLTGRGAY